MNIIGICSLCIVAGLIAFIFKRQKPEYSAAISIGCVCAVMLIISTQISSVTDFIYDTFNVSQLNGEYITVLLKSAGICYISQFGSSICTDCGQSSLAQLIETASKVAIILLALPVLTQLLNVVSELSGG